ncbi:MAG TPA: M28 family peptidase [bacterium]|nr:M28 family peptidase [bacterium]
MAFRTAAMLSFPRLAGSEGEAKARERVKVALKAAGLTVEEEWFYCGDFAIRVAARWAMVPTGAMLLAAALLLKSGWPAAAFVLALASFLPAAYVASRAQSGFRSGSKRPAYRLANIVGRLPAGPAPGPAVILMAHYDSKSQTFPIWLRILLFIISAAIGGALVVLLSACAIILMLGATCFFAPVILPLAIALFAVSLSFLGNRVGNLSDGALDNATGVGIICEIAARLAADPPPGLALRVVATAGEEIGLCGSLAYLDAHRAELDPRRTVVINFDGCGRGRVPSVLAAYGLPRRRVPAGLMQKLDHAAAENCIPLKKIYIPAGMATDLMPWRRAGYNGLDFIGPAYQSHTPADRISLVNERILADYVKLGHELSRALSSRF